jgi:hypothetical protein
MDQPPKPILDRLPALPPRPSSRSNLPSPVREEAAKKRLTARLEAMKAAQLEPPSVDPRTAAVAALMVSNFVSEETIRRQFIPLVGAKLFDVNALEDLPVAARFVLRILPKLGPELDEREVLPTASLVTTVRAIKEEMLRVASRHLGDIDDVHGRLVTVRLGETPAEHVYDLRMLADVWRAYGETLATEAGAAYRPEAEREARELATHLEMALLGPLSAEDEEWRSYLHRALAMLGPLYGEVCRAGRFIFYAERPESRFPSLVSVARVRRRLKRESNRRGESLPPPSGPSSRPPPTSIPPPEVSLVEISDSDESALAEAVSSVSTLRTPEPDTARSPSLNPLEEVSLDFSSLAGAGEDADADFATPDLDLEVTYASESNFYADVAGKKLGLFVATYVVKQPGTPIAVRLTLPQLDEPVHLKGTVRWVREFSPSIEAPPGMGVELAKLPPQAKRAVEAFVKVRPPLLHDE